MPTTTFGVWYPDDTAPVAPLESLFAQVATTIDTALAGMRSKVPYYVANATERDLLYPSPGLANQGARVWRNDIGAEETYYAAYNATTNPGGQSVAGWYAQQGLPFAMAAGSGSNGNSAYGTVNFPVGRFTQPPIVVATTNGGVVYPCNVGTVTKDSAQIAAFSGGGAAAVAATWNWMAIQVRLSAGAG